MDLKDFEMGKNEIFLHKTILFNVLKGYILIILLTKYKNNT